MSLNLQVCRIVNVSICHNLNRVAAACTVFLVLVCVGQVDADEQGAEVAKISPEVSRFLDKHCVRCHGPEKQNAEVRFDTMPRTIPDGTIALKWQDVLDVLNLGQMPPADEPQPSKEEGTNAIETLTANLLEARLRLTDTGGEVVLRRLNRRQYVRTIDDLFGVPVDVSMLPEDASVDGFDTLGQAQNFSSLHLERYLEIGQRVLDHAYNFEAIRRQRPYHHVEEAEVRVSREFNDDLPRLLSKIEGYDKSIGGGNKSHITPRAVMQMEVSRVREYFARPETAMGALVPFRGLSPYVWASFNDHIRPGKYRVQVRCGVAADQAGDDVYLQVVRGAFRSKVPDAIDYYHVIETMAEPQLIEFTIDVDHIRSNRLQFSRRDFRSSVLERFEKTPEYYFKYPSVATLADDVRPDLWIDSIELDGPLPRDEPALSAQSLLNGEEPKDIDKAEARTIIERFAFEAFRHEQPDSHYIDHLAGIYGTSLEQGAKPADALKDALVVVLATPRFLFLEEPSPEPGDHRPLTDRELAVRLSYFLWSSPPDADLFRLAQEGRLHESDVLAGQVDRLLDSPRSDVFVESFATQWLELNRLSGITPAGVVSPVYDDAVYRHSRREVFAFIRSLLNEDRPVTDLLDSDYVVVSGPLAEFYGLDGVTGHEFRKVMLPADSPRGGLLGQSAILTLTGTGIRTSPVERGAYVLRKLLHRPPPPPPANVPMLDEESIGQRSIRDTLATHQSAPQCASCHRRIDPLGFALENFDPVGQWRTSVLAEADKSSNNESGAAGRKKSRAKEVIKAVPDEPTHFPIDTRGAMPDGVRTFNGPRELKQKLLEDRESFLRGLTEAIMTYGLGRTIGFSDQPQVDEIVELTIKQDYRLRALIHEIIRSDAFTTR